LVWCLRWLTVPFPEVVIAEHPSAAFDQDQIGPVIAEVEEDVDEPIFVEVNTQLDGNERSGDNFDSSRRLNEARCPARGRSPMGTDGRAQEETGHPALSTRGAHGEEAGRDSGPLKRNVQNRRRHPRPSV
jgi:hypothetical protein